MLNALNEVSSDADFVFIKAACSIKQLTLDKGVCQMHKCNWHIHIFPRIFICILI